MRTLYPRVVMSAAVSTMTLPPWGGVAIRRWGTRTFVPFRQRRGHSFRGTRLSPVSLEIIGRSSRSSWCAVFFSVTFRFRRSEVHGNRPFHIFFCWSLPLSLTCDGVIIVNLSVRVSGCLPVQWQILVLIGRGRGERSESESGVESRCGVLLLR